MINYFLIFDDCCFYEIVILSYFMRFTNQDVKYCSVDGNGVRCMEGFRIVADSSIEDISKDNLSSFIIPGGDINNIRRDKVLDLLRNIKRNGGVIAAICAGVDLLQEANILSDIHSTHSDDTDVAKDQKVITARANAYVDFAIEVAKELDLFEDEQDLQETIDFWKYHKRM